MNAKIRFEMYRYQGHPSQRGIIGCAISQCRSIYRGYLIRMLLCYDFASRYTICQRSTSFKLAFLNTRNLCISPGRRRVPQLSHFCLAISVRQHSLLPNLLYQSRVTDTIWIVYPHTVALVFETFITTSLGIMPCVRLTTTWRIILFFKDCFALKVA